ncbi:MAG: pentapeptide repeat-containing protein [Syntrophobacteraceae bacterium]
MAELKRFQVLMAVISGRGPAFLRGVDLSGLDLSGAGWLAEADLSGADLEGANLRRANLRGANLEMANLHSANLHSANLHSANLYKVKARVANMSMAVFRGANLKEASLVGASLIKANLEEADLDGADLEGANFEASNLKRARITNVNLTMTNLDGADLTEAIFDGCGASPRADDSVGTDFHGAIKAIRLADLLQIGCLSHSSMRIDVYSKHNRGDILIGSGKILHAHTNGIEGELALMMIFGWETGHFVAYPSAPTNTITIDKPVEHLLLQWRRLEDEKNFLTPDDNHSKRNEYADAQ